jgi:hypothetical protein
MPPKKTILKKKVVKTKSQKLGIYKVGEFESNSGMIIMSDPSYDDPPDKPKKRDRLTATKLKNVAKGKWNAYAKYIKVNVVVVMYAFHKDIIIDNVPNIEWEKCYCDVITGSGQIAIADSEHYRNDWDTYWKECSESMHADREGDRWQLLCSTLTTDKNNIDMITGGVAANGESIGETYRTFCHKNKSGEIDAIKVLLTDDDYDVHELTDDEEFARVRALPSHYVSVSDDEEDPEQYTFSEVISKKVKPKRSVMEYRLEQRKIVQNFSNRGSQIEYNDKSVPTFDTKMITDITEYMKQNEKYKEEAIKRRKAFKSNDNMRKQIQKLDDKYPEYVDLGQINIVKHKNMFDITNIANIVDTDVAPNKLNKKGTSRNKSTKLDIDDDEDDDISIELNGRAKKVSVKHA